MFDGKTFEKAVAERNRNWTKTDAILYQMCRDMPRHDSPGETRAKLLIIGRSYATGIERTVRSKGQQGSSVEQLAEYFCRNATLIDGQMDRIRSLDGSRVEHFREAVDVHGHLVRILTKKICTRSPRSFVSKYLHFHFPFVPIYDSYAQLALSRAIPWTDAVEEAFKSPRSADETYCFFCKRFWTLYEEAASRKPQALVKELDRYLCYLERAHRRRSSRLSGP